MEAKSDEVAWDRVEAHCIEVQVHCMEGGETGPCLSQSRHRAQSQSDNTELTLDTAY